MNEKKTWPAALALAGLCCLANQGWAQQSAAMQDEVEVPAALEDLLVTASLEPISVQDVAASVTVITREEIEQRQVKYLSDLLRDQDKSELDGVSGWWMTVTLSVSRVEFDDSGE